jgi:shikimate kinase
MISRHFIFQDRPYKLPKHVVLVGIMGAGKTSVGKLLANRLGLPFIDSDHEVEQASGCKIADFFDIYGEASYRDGESKVIQRLLELPLPHVISTGGGAYLHPETREVIKDHAISIWIRAQLETLLKRVARRNDRPLLNKGNQREILAKIMQDRYSTYQEANITVDSESDSAKTTVNQVILNLCQFLDELENPPPPSQSSS